MQAWDVYLNEENIDTVFFDDDIDKVSVLLALINHDGYDPVITIERDTRY